MAFLYSFWIRQMVHICTYYQVAKIERFIYGYSAIRVFWGNMKNTMLTIAVAFLFLIVIPGYGISEVDNNLSFHTQTIAICEYGEASV